MAYSKITYAESNGTIFLAFVLKQKIPDFCIFHPLFLAENNRRFGCSIFLWTSICVKC